MNSVINIKLTISDLFHIKGGLLQWSMEISCHKKGRQIKSIADKTKRNHGSGPPSNFGVKMKRNHGTGPPSNLCVINKQKLWKKWTVVSLKFQKCSQGKKNNLNTFSTLYTC